MTITIASSIMIMIMFAIVVDGVVSNPFLITVLNYYLLYVITDCNL